MENIGTLAGGIAHDFNNILTAIIGYTEMARISAPDGSLLRRNLDQVLQPGFRARDPVRQILTFSRQTEQERKPVQIGPIVKEALSISRSLRKKSQQKSKPRSLISEAASGYYSLTTRKPWLIWGGLSWNRSGIRLLPKPAASKRWKPSAMNLTHLIWSSRT
jgi:signal transduction histidine kinase